jgi:hypothetical protein
MANYKLVKKSRKLQLPDVADFDDGDRIELEDGTVWEVKPRAFYRVYNLKSDPESES